MDHAYPLVIWVPQAWLKQGPRLDENLGVTYVTKWNMLHLSIHII